MIKRVIKKSVRAIASCDSSFYFQNLIYFKSGLRNNTIKNEVNLTDRTVLSC